MLNFTRVLCSWRTEAVKGVLLAILCSGKTAKSDPSPCGLREDPGKPHPLLVFLRQGPTQALPIPVVCLEWLAETPIPADPSKALADQTLVQFLSLLQDPELWRIFSLSQHTAPSTLE